MSIAVTATFIAIAALTPTLTCLIGIILSHRDRGKYNNDMKALRAEFRPSIETFNRNIRARIF